jgi:Cu2+-containing amine oxidase
MAHEIMKKREKDIHDAREAAKKAEEATERERWIGIVLWPLASAFVFVTSDWLIFSTTAELPPPPEPFDPLADPEMKKAIEIINMDESIIDKVVTKLLNEVAGKVLKED